MRDIGQFLCNMLHFINVARNFPTLFTIGKFTMSFIVKILWEKLILSIILRSNHYKAVRSSLQLCIQTVALLINRVLVNLAYKFSSVRLITWR